MKAICTMDHRSREKSQPEYGMGREGSHHGPWDQCLALKARQCLKKHQDGSWSRPVGDEGVESGSQSFNSQVFIEYLLCTRLSD